MVERVPVTVIGAGVVGCAIAYALARAGKEVVVLERNAHVPGENQSSRNSGVIHAGVYYPQRTEPNKARLSVAGNRMLYDFCAEFDVPHARTGKLIVATNPCEEEYLDAILETAVENGVPDIRRISGVEARALEPNVAATAALHVPTSGIIEATAYVQRLRSLAEQHGAYVLPGHRVEHIRAGDQVVTIQISIGETTEIFETEHCINAAGLYATDIARMVNPDLPFEVMPARGEAVQFSRSARPELGMRGMNVYPTPYGYYRATSERADVPFTEFKRLLEKGEIVRTVGVHLTPTFALVDGAHVVGDTVTVGPLYTLGHGREGYAEDLHAPADFVQRICRFFPGLRPEDVTPYQTGIMAVLRGHRDFTIAPDAKHPRMINLLGIDSPGLTASLAIARDVAELVRG